MTYRLGIDTGGTFTDLILMDRDGRVELFKTPSTPHDPPEAIRHGIDLVSRSLGIETSEFLGECDLIIHGTTVALNALIQLKGAKTGLFCTRGHEDSLEIRLGHKEDGHRYDFLFEPAVMLVPRRHRVPVSERVTSDGSIRTPLDEDDIYRGIELFKRDGVEAVGVCFLWSFRNPDHERRVGEILSREMPDANVTLSVDLLPQIREYTRVSTVAVNAFIGPILTRYIDSIESLLRDLGYSNPIRYVQSNGGLTSGRVLAVKAVAALNSGPAAGPSASLFFSSSLGKSEILTLDVGGTSSDISLIHDGRVDLVKDVDIARYRIGLPLVNVVSIGAGGGSIAWIDPQGILHVGPQSAEAIPGPACYGLGGKQATVTDSLVVLGYLSQESLLGGELPISSEAAQAVVRERIGRRLNLSDARAALGIFSVVNANMVSGIRAVSVERGYDPRDFVLVAGGGAAAAHAGRLAQELGIHRVLVPKVASGLCAFGEVIADVKHSYLASYTSSLPLLDPDHLNRLFGELEDQGRRDLAEEGFSSDEIVIERSVDMKYVDQVHECSVPIPVFQIDRDRVARLADAFHTRHEALYTYCERDNTPELINVEVTVYGRSPRVAIPSEGAPAAECCHMMPAQEREAYFAEYGEYRKTRVFDGLKLRQGHWIEGPAIIEEPTTTIVAFPSSSIKLLRSDLYVIEIEGAR